MPLPTPNSSNNKVRKASSGSRPVVTSLSTAKTAGSTTAALQLSTGWTTDTAVDVVIYRKNTDNVPVAGTQTDWVATLSGTTLANMVLRAGTEPVAGYPADALTVVKVAPTAAWADDLAEAWYEEHKEDGSHGGVTADSLTVNGVSFADNGWYKGAQYFTSSGTYNKPTGLKFVVVEVQAGGGGGGGSATTSSTQNSCAGAGGGGGYSKKKILATDLASSETVTVGTGGAGGTAGANNGATGGASSFGTHATTTGGTGGTGGAASTGTAFAGGGDGGTASSGDINLPGGEGGAGVVLTGVRVITATSGTSVLGNGVATTSTTGKTGRVYGGGGGGSALASSSSAVAGGAGGAGVVIVHEYF